MKTIEAHELVTMVLETEEHGDPSRITAIKRNLGRKMAKGTYSSDKAPKAWLYAVDDAAKDYVKHCSREPMPWHKMFPIVARRDAAEYIARLFEGANGWEG